MSQFINQGSYGRVYSARPLGRAKRECYAIKRQEPATEGELEAALSELRHHWVVSTHPNVVTLHACRVGEHCAVRPASGGGTAPLRALGSPQPPCEVSLLMELCPGGCFIDYMRAHRGQRFTEAAIWSIGARLASCICSMHARGVVHRDIKLENLLLAQGFGGKPPASFTPSDAQYLRLCDFGSCTDRHWDDPSVFLHNKELRQTVERDIRRNTTHVYRAPEMMCLFNRYPIGCKSDVFSFGVALFRLMYFVLPFPPSQSAYQFNCIYCFPDEDTVMGLEPSRASARGEWARRRGGDEPDVPHYSMALKDVVRRCLVKDPEERASIWDVAEVLCKRCGVRYELPPSQKARQDRRDWLDRARKRHQGQRRVRMRDGVGEAPVESAGGPASAPGASGALGKNPEKATGPGRSKGSAKGSAKGGAKGNAKSNAKRPVQNQSFEVDRPTGLARGESFTLSEKRLSQPMQAVILDAATGDTTFSTGTAGGAPAAGGNNLSRRSQKLTGQAASAAQTAVCLASSALETGQDSPEAARAAKMTGARFEPRGSHTRHTRHARHSSLSTRAPPAPQPLQAHRADQGASPVPEDGSVSGGAVFGDAPAPVAAADLSANALEYASGSQGQPLVTRDSGFGQGLGTRGTGVDPLLSGPHATHENRLRSTSRRRRRGPFSCCRRSLRSHSDEQQLGGI